MNTMGSLIDLAFFMAIGLGGFCFFALVVRVFGLGCEALGKFLEDDWNGRT